MKKYKATKNHPFIEVGKKFEYCESRHRIIFTGVYYEFPLPPVTIDDWIENKYITEIQKPKWTDDQLKTNAVQFANRCMREGHLDGIYTTEMFDNWIRDKS